MACNVSEIFAVGLGALAQGPLPILPLQILFLNLVTDVFPALALGVCEGSPALMREPPRDPREPVLTRRHWRDLFALGGVISLSVLAALLLAVHWPPLARVLEVADPGASGWALAFGFSLVPLVAGQLGLLRRFR